MQAFEQGVVVKAVFKDIETFRVGPPPVFTGFRLKQSAPAAAANGGSPMVESPMMPSNGDQTPVIPRAESTESLVSQGTEDNTPPSVAEDKQSLTGMMDIDLGRTRESPLGLAREAVQ